MRFPLCLIFVFFILYQHNSLGQENLSSIFEIVKDDSVKMYFSERGRFIEKNCSDFVRYTKVTSEGNFNGYFEDYSQGNILIGKGHYVRGMKHGHFENYYPNGKIRSRGNYTENKPAGLWEYFYENELPERTIRITDFDTLLIKFVDKKGNLKVIDGNGEFDGLVAANAGFQASIVARGKVQNGKPHGKWTSMTSNNNMFCNEEFDQGKLLKGNFPNARGAGKTEYNNKSFLNTFFLSSYLSALENFRSESCADAEKHAANNSYSFDIQGFRSDVGSRIDRVIENDLKTGKIDYYMIGDNYLTIQFSIDKDGKADDFALLTAWGEQFVSAISSSIRRQTKFPPSVGTMFFHMRLHYAGGPTYQYTFQFSRKKTL